MKIKALILIFTMSLLAAKVAGQCSFTTQPAATTTVCPGGSVTLTVDASGGTTMTYQWFSNTSASNSGGTSIPLATGASYSVPTATAGTYYFYCEATGIGALTCGPTPSSAATVTVNPTLTASVSIGASANPVCAGTSVTFTATPTNGGTPAYQWRVNGSPFGTNSNTYAYTPVTGDVVTVEMTSTATPCLAGSPATSNSITMTVNPTLTASVSIVASANPSCAGSAVTFTATPTNGGSTPSYQWQVNSSNAGSNSNTFIYTPVSGDVINVIMTSNATPCLTGSPATSGNITMTVNALPIPTLSSSAAGNKSCPGTSVTFTAGGAGTGTYQFFRGGVSQGAPSTTNTYTTTTLTDGQIVTVTIVDGNNCTATHPGISTTIYAYPAVNDMAASAGTGESYSIVPVNGTNGTVPSGTTYSWVQGTPFSSNLTIVSGATGTDQTSITGNMTHSKSSSRVGTFFVTPKNDLCTGAVFNLTMTILPGATISDKTTAICNSSTFTVIPVDDPITPGGDVVPSGTTYSWPLPVAAGISGLASGPAGSANISGTLTNSTSLPVNVEYTVTPKSGTVTGATFKVTVTVRPTAVVNQPANQIKCNGDASNAVIFSGVANSFDWTNSNTSTGLAASGTGDISSFTATNAGIIPVTSTVNVTPYYDGCSGTAKSFTITVNPLPTLSGVAQDDQICSGSAAIINLTGLLSGTTSTIGYKIGTTAQTPVSGVLATGTSGSFTISGMDAVNNGKVLEITSVQNQGTGCSATFTTNTLLIVNSATTPTISVISGNDPPCINSTVVYSTQAGMTGYIWTVPSGGTITGGAGTNSISVNWSSAGSHTVTVNYTNSNGCTAVSPAIKNVTVFALPTPTISGPGSACINSTGNVYVTEPGMLTYTWSITGGIITSGSTAPGSNQAIVTWTSAGPRSISVNCTNSAGCAASAAFTYNVTVNPLPVPTFTAGPAVARVTSTGNIYSTQAGMSNYVWNVSGGATITAGGTSTSSSVTVTWNTTGPQSVSVSYTNTSSCTAAAPTVQNVTVNPIPSVSNVQISGTPAIGNTLTGSYNYTDGGGGSNVSTLRWLKNGVTPVGGTTNTYIVQPSDLNSTITFEVTPVSTVGPPNAGIAVKSSPTVPVEDLSEIPVADQVCIEGVRSAGSIIKGKYRYTHSKPEGASILKWYIDGVFKANGSTYTLLSTDIDAGEAITFEVTPVSSNIIPVSGIAVISDELAKIPLWPVDYSVSGTSVPLSATPSGGIFSGPGVTNGNFSPNSVGIGGPYNINYQLIIVNSATTCSQQVTKAVNVVASTTELSNFKPVYCNDESPSVITVTGVPPGSTSLGFSCTDVDAIVGSTALTVTIDPRKMSPGTNVDVLYFSYRDILFNTYTISKSFVIDKVGTNIQILNLDAEYCTDAPIAAITVTGATPAGGTAIWTGTVLTDLTPVSASVVASKGTPGQTYPLSYQYITPSGCKSAILTPSVTINPLPNTAFTLNKFYNYDGPEIDLIPVQSPGTFSGNGVVSNNKFLPKQAGPGEHTINYYIRDDKGCDDSRDSTTTIKIAQGTFKLDNGEPFPKDICYRDTTFVINVTGLPDKSTVISFVNSKNSLVHTPGTTSASYNVPAAGEGIDTLILSYKLDAVDYWISSVVNIDSLGLVDFINFLPGEKICDNIAPFKLNATPTGGIFYGPVAGNFLDPDTTAGSYSVKYVYKNQDTRCSISKTIPIEIIKAPKVSFVAKDACIVNVGKDSTYFLNSTVSSDPVSSWKWKFAEVGNPASSRKEPGYLYTSGGIHTVKLEVITLNGCLSDTSIAIDLGVRPNADFYWTNDCYSPDENLKLFDVTTSDFEILRRNWNFDDSTKTSNDLNPEYPMPAVGYVKVQYVVETNYSTCADTLIKYIFLNPTVTLTEDNFYFETFESGKGGWEKNDSDIRNSWKYGNPDRSVINSAYSGSNAWFTGYDTVKHLKEASSVISQCFDFTDIKRPMIALKTFKRFDKNRNGAALQYKTDDNNSWKLVGTLDDGIDWYNSTLITGEPGGQKVGWTTINTPDEKWIDSRHELDSLAGKKNIKFRIAYGSDGTSQNSEGLAFDDVWIGERSRKVLLEHFTNTGSRSGSEATKLVDDILTRRMNDVINIQYHTNFPDNDLFYTANQGDASARIFSYGLSRVPYSMIDGGNQLIYASLADYKSVQTDLDTNDLSRRSLLDTRFTVSVKGTEASGVLTVKSTIISTVSGSFDNLVLYMVVTEKKNSSTETGALGEKTFYNIFRKFIPDAGGIELKKSWTKGEEVVIPDQIWAIPGNLSDSEIEVIAFIQDTRTKEVYQVESDLLTTAKSGISNSPNEATAGSEDLSKETATSFGLYPNPADERLTIEFNNRLAAVAEIRIFDLQGVIKATYKVASGESGLFIEDLSLKAGIYFVRVTSGSVDLGFKKLIVTGE